MIMTIIMMLVTIGSEDYSYNDSGDNATIVSNDDCDDD